MAIVGVFTVPQSEAIDLIKNLNDDDFYFIGSKIDQIKFDKGKDKLISLGLWENGKLFNEKYEIRWRLEGGNYKMTILTEIDKLPQISDRINYEQIDHSWITNETKIMLWGSYKKYNDSYKGFLEVRIPNFMDYPDPKGKQWKDGDKALINCVNYLKDGITLYTRFKEVANV